MSINLTDRQKEAFRQLVARKDELYGRPFNIDVLGGGNPGFYIVQLGDHPIFEYQDFNEYVRVGLLDPYGENSYTLTNLGETAVANDFQETGTLITDLKDILLKLHKNLNDLRDREAKFGEQAPPELLNQIDDHLIAIDLTGQLIEAASDVQYEIGSLNIDSQLRVRLISILGEK